MIRVRGQEQRLPKGVYRMDDQQIVFRGSLAGRVFCGLFALVFAASGCFMLGMTITHPLYLARAWSYLMASFYGAMALGAWYGAGPRETAFDLRRGTYRLTTGFPFFPRTQHGSWNDFAGLFVRSYDRASSNMPPHYWVCLAWNQPRRRDIILLRHSDAAVVDRIMRQTADALGRPVGGDALGLLWLRNARLRRCDDGGLAFHKPPGVRLAWGICGKMIAIASLVLSGAVVVAAGRLHFHSGNTNSGIVLLDIVGLLCLRAAGPEDLEIDLGSRTYRCRCGVPYLCQERAGPLQDIVALKTDTQGSSGVSRVRLVWKQPKRADMTLAEFGSPEEADAHRRMIAARLGWEDSGTQLSGR